MTFQKFDHGKPRMSLIPPDFERSLAEVFTHGAAKYGENNWTKGPDWSRYLDAARRHLNAYASGEDHDPDSGLPHVDMAAACIAILSACQKRGIGNDDRSKLGPAIPRPAVVDVSQNLIYTPVDRGGL